MSYLLRPSAEGLCAAQTQMWRALLDDVTEINDALDRNVGGYDGSRVGPLISELRRHRFVPEMFAWYFDLLNDLERNDVDAAVGLMSTMGNVVVVPLYAQRHSTQFGRTVVPVAVRDSHVALPQLSEVLYVGAGTDMELSSEGIRVGTQPLNIDGLVRKNRFRHRGSEYWCGGSAVDDGLREILGEEQSEHPERITLVPISRDSLEHRSGLMDALAQGLSHVGCSWPELFDEMECVTHAYVLLKGKQFVGGSSLRLPGVIWLRVDERWGALALADHLVHEAAHCALFVGSELAPLVENPNLMCPSPIRRQERPLLGTVHATFVFQRLVGFFQRAMDSGWLSADDCAEAEARLHRHALGLIGGVELVRTHAVLTAAGKVWLQEVERMVAEEIAGLGPSPEVASRVFGDYDRLEAASAFRSVA